MSGTTMAPTAGTCLIARQRRGKPSRVWMQYPRCGAKFANAMRPPSMAAAYPATRLHPRCLLGLKRAVRRRISQLRRILPKVRRVARQCAALFRVGKTRAGSWAAANPLIVPKRASIPAIARPIAAIISR